MHCFQKNENLGANISQQSIRVQKLIHAYKQNADTVTHRQTDTDTSCKCQPPCCRRPTPFPTRFKKYHSCTYPSETATTAPAQAHKTKERKTKEDTQRQQQTTSQKQHTHNYGIFVYIRAGLWVCIDIDLCASLLLWNMLKCLCMALASWQNSPRTVSTRLCRTGAGDKVSPHPSSFVEEQDAVPPGTPRDCVGHPLQD